MNVGGLKSYSSTQVKLYDWKPRHERPAQIRTREDGQVASKPAVGKWSEIISLLLPVRKGGIPLMEAPSERSEADLYVALSSSAYVYNAMANDPQHAATTHLRRVTGYQDLVDEAPLDRVFVADHSRMKMVPATPRESHASAAAGAISQNVYLLAASNSLPAVTRALIDFGAIADALGLNHDQQVLLSQTGGYPEVWHIRMVAGAQITACS